MTRTGFVERKGRMSELDRSFDLSFWQAQPPQARFEAAWELIVHYAKVKGLDVRQLRLHRSVETFQRQQRSDLITSKLASGRPQDLIDADLLSQSDAD